MSRSAKLLAASLACFAITGAYLTAGLAEPAKAPVSTGSIEALPTGLGNGLGHGLGLGREAKPEEIAGWAISVRPDGEGLPDGRGTVLEGEDIYVAQCAVCHGDFGESAGRWPMLAGGNGTLASHDPVKTIGSYWPYASTLIDYIYRSMPYGNAQSLTPDELYAVTAYILYLNDVILDEDFELNRENFTSIKLPNETEFYPDDRETTEAHFWKTEACMENCAEGEAEIRNRARALDVTPEAGQAPRVE